MAPGYRWLYVAAATAGVLTIVVLGMLRGAWIGRTSAPDERRGTPLAAGEPIPVLWDVPVIEGVDQNGREFSAADLEGRVWISNFIFTRCASVCPRLTARMIQLQRELTHEDLRFVSLSVDPEHDSPERLLRYAETWNGDAARWRLVHLDPAALAGAAAGMKVAVEPSDEPASPILHSDLFLLVDSSGRVRGVYGSESDGAMRSLVADARRLLNDKSESPVEMPTSARREATGEDLYYRFSCAGCHDNPAVAPPLQNLSGRQVRLRDGRTVRADDAYLRESLLQPHAALVDGFLALMPSYREQLTDDEVDALVAFLRERSSAGPAGPEPAASSGTGIDPVCGMEVARGPATPWFDHGGRRHYFCAETCRDRFAENPAKYASAPRVSP